MIVINSDFKTIQITSFMISKDDIPRRVYRFLLPKVMTATSPSFPSRQQMLSHLESLYGAYFKTRSQLFGDLFVSSITLAFPHPRVVTDETLLTDALRLMREVLDNKTFEQDAFLTEKRLLLEQWKTLKEHKRHYAGFRFSTYFYGDDPYSVPVSGTFEDVQNASFEGLILEKENDKNLGHQILVSNGAFMDHELDILKATFPHDDRNQVNPVLSFRPVRDNPVTFDESDQMKQAIIKIGFVLPVFRRDPLHNAAIVFDTLFGGYADSLLFTEVRERQGLCYDIQSSYDSYKGTLVVSAGVDPARQTVALDSINRLLDDLKNNGPTPEQLESAKRYVVYQLKSTLESQSTLTARALAQTLLETYETVDERITDVMTITADDVLTVIRKTMPDTTYVLSGGVRDEDDQH